jgi:sorbitol/mannitol transport system substrate-binding protein
VAGHDDHPYARFTCPSLTTASHHIQLREDNGCYSNAHFARRRRSRSCSAAAYAQDTTITIATVNNGDMIRMQGYTDQFTAETGIAVEWVTLEENVLRQRVTTDITTNGGQFDIMTIGMYETPIWGANGWLVPLDGLSAEYNVDDILPAMRGGLSHDGTLYAAPFYGESSMVMYRTDLMEAAGLEMPDAPTWDFIVKQRRP